MSGMSADSFEKIYESVKSRSITKSMYRGDVTLDSVTGNELFESDAQHSDIANIVRNDFRVSFNKSGQNNSSIGCHPDFAELAGTDNQVYHHISSLFLDIRNSTRLSFLFPLEEVVIIKNSILIAASEAVRALDGYVHRFMGDALLAFFGNKHTHPDSSTVDAINCASLLEALMVGSIIPFLKKRGVDADYLGFRIGLDYGPDEKVLWASYGLGSVVEVTATSFHVDVAAKLQNMARKNTAMLGETIYRHMDLPDEYMKVKTKKVGDEIKPLTHLDRTYTDAQGFVHKYAVRELNHDAYRDLLPLPASNKSLFPGTRVIACDGIDFECVVIEDGAEIPYPSVSRVLNKGLDLKFKLRVRPWVRGKVAFPLTVYFIKRNYGTEAQLEKGQGKFPKTPRTVLLNDPNVDTPFFAGWNETENEGTRYRGLHTMEAEVKDANGLVVYRDIIGVYIK